MKAIIVAAGRALRLHPISDNIPKCLLKVGENVTILEHQLQNLRECGVNDIILVTGYCEKEIRKLCGDTVKYVYNPFFDITNMLVSLWFAREEMRDGFIFSYSDILYHKQILSDLIANKNDIVMVVDRKETDWESEKVKVDYRGLITEVSKNVPPEEAFGEFIGLAKLSPKGATLLAKELDEMVREGSLSSYLTRAFERLARKGYEVHMSLTSGNPWIEIDFPEELNRARDEVFPAIQRKRK
jgi:choline kinase